MTTQVETATTFEQLTSDLMGVATGGGGGNGVTYLDDPLQEPSRVRTLGGSAQPTITFVSAYKQKPQLDAVSQRLVDNASAKIQRAVDNQIPGLQEYLSGRDITNPSSTITPRNPGDPF